MPSMKVTIPYLDYSTNRIGKRYYYYRRSGRRVALVDAQGNRITSTKGKAFHEAYSAAERQFHVDVKDKPVRAAPGTVAWLVTRYKTSPAFERLADNTAKTYGRELAELCRLVGDIQASQVTPSDVAALQDAMAHKPCQADRYVARLKTVYDFGIRIGAVTQNPAAAIKAQHKGTPYETWPEEDIHRLMTCCRPEVGRVVLWLYRTGLRISDCISIDQNQIIDGSLHIKERKTGTGLVIPLHEDLLRELGSRPTPIRHVLLNSKGKPWTRSGFRVSCQKEAKKHGIHWRPVHGMRKAAITSLIEAGCTAAEVSAVTGQTMQMVEHYAAARNRAQLAQSAMQKMKK